ncbi:sulfatase family protein [Rhodopirellula sallentina]|uniref:Arylsulfatase A n=1 Tax=Rhodopirellula sallentina SM41 TaxID=1263870 RepID=M5UBL5_9BACT|nr:arylsulfatase [Rhodopirellula sallentina]EMI53398.1 arylsulfatase A [Rhodopirellula sallentina SM41]
MNRLLSIGAALSLGIVFVCSLSVADAADPVATISKPQPPNIVLIFADDLGYGDLGCYGATKVQTPNIDRLATEGRRFTDAHSASAVCSPSRYGLLTGEYPFRKNFWGPVGAGHPLMIDEQHETIADVLKDSGYQTAYFGKWHLGFGKTKPKWNQELQPGPLERGFDYFYGIPCANSVPPYVYVENHHVVGRDPDDPMGTGKKVHAVALPEKGAGRFGGGKVAHDLYVDEMIGTNLTERSIKWLQSTDKDTPFFLMLSTTNIHHPFTPAPQFKGSSEAGLYGDFIAELDWITGQIMGCLDAQGIAENTLVIFTSDNGGMLNMGGQAAVKMGHDINGELLGSKFGVWEGGHRVPMIVRWPNHVPAGTTSDDLISHIDFLATFAAITGGTLENPRDSVDQLATLTGTPGEPARPELLLCPNSPRHLSIRHGDWVYIPEQGEGGFQGDTPGERHLGGAGSVPFLRKTNSDVVDGQWSPDAPHAQLYNLAEDRAQTTNVITSHPEMAQEFAARLEKERASIPKTKPIGWININIKKKR